MAIPNCDSSQVQTKLMWVLIKVQTKWLFIVAISWKKSQDLSGSQTLTLHLCCDSLTVKGAIYRHVAL